MGCTKTYNLERRKPSLQFFFSPESVADYVCPSDIRYLNSLSFMSTKKQCSYRNAWWLDSHPGPGKMWWVGLGGSLLCLPSWHIKWVGKWSVFAIIDVCVWEYPDGIISDFGTPLDFRGVSLQFSSNGKSQLSCEGKYVKCWSIKRKSSNSLTNTSCQKLDPYLLAVLFVNRAWLRTKKKETNFIS